MSLVIKVPPVGESISEVTLSQWIKKDGDYVEMDEIIAELESDKATFELTAEKAGTLKTIAKRVIPLRSVHRYAVLKKAEVRLPLNPLQKRRLKLKHKVRL
jgi:hypothetical protein